MPRNWLLHLVWEGKLACVGDRVHCLLKFIPLRMGQAVDHTHSIFTILGLKYPCDCLSSCHALEGCSIKGSKSSALKNYWALCVEALCYLLVILCMAYNIFHTQVIYVDGIGRRKDVYNRGKLYSQLSADSDLSQFGCRPKCYREIKREIMSCLSFSVSNFKISVSNCSLL